MASAERTTGGPSGQTSAGEIAAMQGYFQSGNTITAQHVTYLRDRINSYAGHYHSIYEYQKIHEYGNTDSTAGSAENSEGSGSSASPSGVSAGSTITAAQFNALQGAVNSVRSHSHPWTDD